MRVMATHLIRSGVDMGRTKLEAREAFSRCRQQYNDTIVQFKQRYDGRIAALKTLDEHILEEPALAIDFIHKLDMRRYHQLRKDYKNGLYDRVTSLAERPMSWPVTSWSRGAAREVGSVCLLPMVNQSEAAAVAGVVARAAAGELVHAGGDHQQRAPAPCAKVLLTGPMIVQIRMIRAM